MTNKRVPAKLSQARAYWRLAAKAHKNGQYRDSKKYTDLAERRFREYQRQQEALSRFKGGKS